VNNEDLKEIIEVNFRAVRAELNANGEVMRALNHQIEKQNSRVDKLECKVEKNTAWRIGLTAAGTAVVGVISFIFTKLATIINALK